MTSSLLNPLHLVRRLYDWTMGWSEHKYSNYALSFIACIESFFFPIPADPLLVAMGVSQPKKSIWYAFLTTVFSVLGAVGGYWIGYAFWISTQEFFFTYVFKPEIFEIVSAKYNENAVVAILLASFTPLPFKVFTVAAGVAKIPLMTLVLSSLLGRGLRFFTLGILIYFFGSSIKKFIDKYFNVLVIITGVLLVGGYYFIPKILH